MKKTEDFKFKRDLSHSSISMTTKKEIEKNIIGSERSPSTEEIIQRALENEMSPFEMRHRCIDGKIVRS